MLRTLQYRIRILCKPGKDLFIADWLSWQNHKEFKHWKIPGMKISINAVTDIQKFMSLQDMQQPTLPRLLSTATKRLCHTWMAHRQEWNSTGDVTILDFQRWSGGNRQHTNERQMYHHTRRITETSNGMNSQQPHGH